MTSKRPRSPSPIPFENIYRSSSIEEHTSTFVAAFSPTLSVKALQGLKEFQTATHRIAAWRKPSRQRSLIPESKTLYDLGHDDDGEKAAGARLKHVLNDMDAEGVVVVARWYGGHNIGPIRFTHIENTAKEAIWKWKTVNAGAKQEQAAKKQKFEEETARKELEENLRERDLNIFVLRGLLRDKAAKLNGSEPTPPTPSKPPPDYGKMNMDVLKKLDKARDATIAVILKEIDKVEDQLKLLEAVADSTYEESNDAKESVNAEKSSAAAN